ncbi:universal stress protein [Halorarum halobium]|uniref:universal stress protein n=1 Tax=Halorarum halobium TaxID=3075121 RepID=UPI0028AB9806|nr:universal stress protein [Halobaculum sp. XH14]
MYERVLVPTDGSELSETAARHALDVAAQYGATLHAIYVVDTDTGWLTVSKADVRDAIRELGDNAGEEAIESVERLAADADVDLVTAVLDGSPDDEILRYADEHDADLIVMGTHGRDGIGRRVVGSITERVVRGASVPVMAVNAGSDD